MYNLFALGTIVLVFIIPNYSLGMCRVDKQPYRIKFVKRADKTNRSGKTHSVRIGLAETLDSGKQDKAKSSNPSFRAKTDDSKNPVLPGNNKQGEKIAHVMLALAIQNSGDMAKKLEDFSLNGGDQGSLAEMARQSEYLVQLTKAACDSLVATSGTNPQQQQTSSSQASNTPTTSPATSSWCTLF